jgi:predicted RNA-binding Zn ribbon-like protein
MTSLPRPAASMKLVGGDPCLDFVNTVGGRPRAAGAARTRVQDDKLASYPDLVAFGVHAGLLDEATGRRLLRRSEARPREATALLSRALALREALYRTLQALRLGRRPARADLRTVNAEIAAGRRREELVARRAGLRWQWRGAGLRLESPLWPIVRAAAALLPSPELAQLRLCGGQACGWLFLDRSRNRSRRWCTMEDCGNLSKVRRFRRRQAHRRGSTRYAEATRRTARPSPRISAARPR